MDNRYQDYLSYLEFLHRIGRRTGCRNNAIIDSSKMTYTEQVKMTGLLLKEKNKAGIVIGLSEIQEMMLNDGEATQAEVINSIKDKLLTEYYDEIENLLKLIPEPTNE